MKRSQLLPDDDKLLLYHAIILKFIPLGYALLTFFLIAPLDEFITGLDILDPLILWYGLFLLYTGIIFWIEVGFALPDSKESPSSGIFAAVITAILASLALIFGVGILAGAYVPDNDGGLVNWVLTIVVFSSIIMYFVQGREEFVHRERLLRRLVQG